MVRAENAAGYAQKQFTLKSHIVPSITTTELKAATAGQSYFDMVIASGTTPLTWSAEGLPEGLTFTNGIITGKAKTKGTYPVTVTVSNSAGNNTKILSIDVHAVMPVFGTTSLPAWIWHKAYSTTITMKKGTKPITLEIDGELPDGLTFDADTWTLSGTPKEAGEFTFTVTASNNAGTVSKELEININADPPRVMGSLKSGKVGKEYSSGLKVKEGSLPVTWSITGTLPAGLSFDADTGTISGTPEEACNAYITVKAENSGGTHKKRVRLLIREDRNAENSSLPQERTSEADTKPEERLPEILTDSKPKAMSESAGHVYRVPSSAGGVNIPEGYVIVAELGEISCDMAGMYEFDVVLSDYADIGAKLLYMAGSDKPSDDDEIAEFYDDTGKEITAVPESRLITISIWLNPGTVYKPVIAVTRK